MAKKTCLFCKNKIETVDYKDPSLGKFLTGWAKIKGRSDTRLCARHQRQLSDAVKRARFLGLLPYTGR